MRNSLVKISNSVYCAGDGEIPCHHDLMLTWFVPRRPCVVVDRMLKSKICLKASTSLAEVLFEGYGWMDARCQSLPI